MATYGRNFHTRVSPYPQQRRGRFQLTGGEVPIGAPILVANGADPIVDLTGALPASLATGAQPPKQGFTGVAIYEYIDIVGYDPALTTFGDLDTVPVGEQFQIISGPNVKLVFKNTADRDFYGYRDYEGRIMVAGMGATPTVDIGNYLTPGAGNDTAGYWAVTGSAANAWLVVTNVDASRQEVEAELAF